MLFPCCLVFCIAGLHHIPGYILLGVEWPCLVRGTAAFAASNVLYFPLPSAFTGLSHHPPGGKLFFWVPFCRDRGMC
jgi:hypothetical protein